MKNYLLYILLLLGCVGCQKEVPTVIFTLPNKYEGWILIHEDPQSGLPLVLTNNTCTISVPENGKILVQAYGPLSEWHKTKIICNSGDEIPYMKPTATSAVAFYDLGSIQGEGIYCIVGTAEDYKTTIHTMVISKPTFGNKNLKSVTTSQP